jgi:hypothetical protein
MSDNLMDPKLWNPELPYKQCDICDEISPGGHVHNMVIHKVYAAIDALRAKIDDLEGRLL